VLKSPRAVVLFLKVSYKAEILALLKPSIDKRFGSSPVVMRVTPPLPAGGGQPKWEPHDPHYFLKGFNRSGILVFQKRPAVIQPRPALSVISIIGFLEKSSAGTLHTFKEEYPGVKRRRTVFQGRPRHNIKKESDRILSHHSVRSITKQ
jgi:hypothetical protein